LNVRSRAARLGVEEDLPVPVVIHAALNEKRGTEVPRIFVDPGVTGTRPDRRSRSVWRSPS
jgi:hypothetical protein